jgi:hypothetical protein
MTLVTPQRITITWPSLSFRYSTGPWRPDHGTDRQAGRPLAVDILPDRIYSLVTCADAATMGVREPPELMWQVCQQFLMPIAELDIDPARYPFRGRLSGRCSAPDERPPARSPGIRWKFIGQGMPSSNFTV